MSAPRPITVLIAALGGEGGGVLTNWIVSAAAEAGFPVQSTSIPGVAQRTGATTYYIEILPVHVNELSGKRPVLALTPGVGDIDIAVASELLEAGRTLTSGFITPDRTHVIASLSRFYAMDEKVAMGDGRFDQDKLITAIKQHAHDALLVDMKMPYVPTARLSTATCADFARGSKRRGPRMRRPSSPTGRSAPRPHCSRLKTKSRANFPPMCGQSSSRACGGWCPTRATITRNSTSTA
jgi:Pyruvate/2-oxoacid:ferredoxin oxidoreductase gamma subunit